MTIRIGLVADTHLFSRRWGPGRLWDRYITQGGRPWGDVLEAMAVGWGETPDEIWHAGDLAGPEVLPSIAERFGVPVHGVRGNADKGRWARDLPQTHQAEIAGRRLVMAHGWGSPKFILDRLMHRLGWGWDAVVFGHTHMPMVRRAEGVLFVNPGSPTDVRFTARPTVAELTVRDSGISAQLVDLEPYLTDGAGPLE